MDSSFHVEGPRFPRFGFGGAFLPDSFPTFCYLRWLELEQSPVFIQPNEPMSVDMLELLISIVSKGRLAPLLKEGAVKAGG